MRQEHTNKGERQSEQDGYKRLLLWYMMYAAEYWAVGKKGRKLHTTEMCMLRWARGKARLDHVRNVDIWKAKSTHVPDSSIPERDDVEIV